MADNDWKSRLGVVFSTDTKYGYRHNEEIEQKTLSPDKQNLTVIIDRRNRSGKQVTLIKGFIGNDADLQELGRLVKTKCGTGGSAKEREIIIQGDFRDRVVSILQTMGYHAKKGN